MIAPKPFIAICKKCGKIRLIAPKSDALSLDELFPRCKKCGEPMQKFGGLFGKFLNEILGTLGGKRF